MRRAMLMLAATFAWPAAASAQGPAEQSLRAFLQSTFAEARAEWPDTSYVSAFADLNGDGREEALVSLHSGLFCGSGGCALYIYTPAGAAWRELAVHVRGGGMEIPHEARMRFDGRTYASNPSMAPRLRGRAPGRVLIGEGTESRRLFP